MVHFGQRRKLRSLLGFGTECGERGSKRGRGGQRVERYQGRIERTGNYFEKKVFGLIT